MPNALCRSLVIILLGVGLPAGSAHSAEPKWPAGAYKYIVVDQDIRDTLVEFGRNVGVSVKVSEQVVGRRIHGKMPTASAEQFLKGLCESYGLVWFFDGAVLHVSAEGEMKTEQIDLGPVTADAVNKRIKALGVTDSRYSVRVIDAHAISVYGPPPYVQAIRQNVTSLRLAMAPREGVAVKVIRGGQESTK